MTLQLMYLTPKASAFLLLHPVGEEGRAVLFGVTCAEDVQFHYAKKQGGRAQRKVL